MECFICNRPKFHIYYTSYSSFITMTDYMMMSTIHALLNTSMTTFTAHMMHLMMLTPSRAELGAMNPFIVDPDYLPSDDITNDELMAENTETLTNSATVNNLRGSVPLAVRSSKIQKTSTTSLGVSIVTLLVC